jgi:hypothetical protein
MLIVAIVAAILSAALRAVLLAVYRKWFRQGFAGDAAFHLAVIRELKKSSRYDGVPHFLIRDEPDTYPIAFHRFAALFPEEWILRRPYLPNLCLWVALSAAAAAYAQYVGAYLLHQPGVGLCFTAFFLALSSNLSSDMNGLNYISLSERLLARFSCALYFAALATAMSFGDTPSLVIAALAGVLACISSMFGRQAVAFVTPLVALFALDATPIIILGAAVLGAILLDRGYFLRGLRHMAQFSHAYTRHTKYSRYYKAGFSHFVNPRILFGRGVPIRTRLFELENREPTRILFRYPELILLGALGILYGDIAAPVLAIIAATLVVYVTTSTPQLRQFGEANRYIEYNLWIVVPMAIVASLFARDTLPIPLLAGYAAWVVAVTSKKFLDWSKLQYPENDRLLDVVKPLNLTACDTVFTVPFTLGAAVSARAPCRALMYQGSAVTLALYQRFMEEVPFLKREWRQLAAEFDVTHIIADKSFLGIMSNMVGWQYDFQGLHKLVENDAYVVYRVDGTDLAVVNA